MAVCILKFKTWQMSFHVQRYTTIGIYKDSSLLGQDTLQSGGWVTNLEEFAASIVRVVQEVKCGIAVFFPGYRFEYSVVAL
jgi:hypothetical protein